MGILTQFEDDLRHPGLIEKIAYAATQKIANN